MSVNSFNSKSTLKVGNKEYEIYRLDALDKQGISTRHLPFSLRILLENLLRAEDGRNVTKEEVRALASWNSNSKPEKDEHQQRHHGDGERPAKREADDPHKVRRRP